MKKIISLCVLLLLLTNCKKEPEKTVVSETSTSNEEPITTKIAYANGFENFEKVNQLNFTFNVKVNDTVRSQRSWKWYPKENKIELTENDETFSYIKRILWMNRQKQLIKNSSMILTGFYFHINLYGVSLNLNLIKRPLHQLAKRKCRV